MIEINFAKPEEWQQYRALRLEMLKESSSAFMDNYDEALEKGDAYWQEAHARNFNGLSLLLVARDGGHWVGQIGAYWSNKAPVRHLATVFGFYLNKEYRGQGIANKLMEKLEFELKQKGFSLLNLDVVETQQNAISFYHKAGFNQCGKHNKYYKSGDNFYDVMIFEKFI